MAGVVLAEYSATPWINLRKWSFRINHCYLFHDIFLKVPGPINPRRLILFLHFFEYSCYFTSSKSAGQDLLVNYDLIQAVTLALNVVLLPFSIPFPLIYSRICQDWFLDNIIVPHHVCVKKNHLHQFSHTHLIWLPYVWFNPGLSKSIMFHSAGYGVCRVRVRDPLFGPSTYN